MLVYILKSTACLLAFMLFYKLVLEQQKMHQFNRFYLIGALFLSFGIPLVTFTKIVEIEQIPFQPTQEVFQLSPIPMETTTMVETVNYLPMVLSVIYCIGLLIFLGVFIKNIILLSTRIRENEKLRKEHSVQVLMQKNIIPHTFLKYIFLDKKALENKEIPAEVLLHEEAHVEQKHSLDILFVEFLKIIFWFNPLIYFIKHSIKLNHEFLADDAVLQNNVDASFYKKILLEFSLPNNDYQSEPLLANSINYSSIKKRFTVMKKSTSKKSILLRSLLLLPLAAILLYSFSTKETKELVLETEQMETTIISQEKTEGATESMMKEYKEFIKEFEKSNTIWGSKLNRAIAIYDLMTQTQRVGVKMYPKTPQGNLAIVKPKSPSTTEYNSWKDSDKFAIWIDGENVSNATLDKYKSSDITYYFVSKVYKNARSKKHPQPFQNNLYTKKGFEKFYLKSNVKRYNTLKSEYQNAQKTLKEGDSELRILKARLDRKYKALSKEEIEKYGVKKIGWNTPNKNQNSKTLKEALKNSVSTKNNNIQQKVIQAGNYSLEFYFRKIDNAIIVSIRKKQMVEAVKKDKLKTYLQDLIKETALKPEKFVTTINIEKNTEKSSVSFVEKTLRSLNILKINKKDYIPPKLNPNYPPPPFPPLPPEPKNSSQALLKLKSQYDKKVQERERAVKQFYVEKTGELSTISLLTDEAIKIQKAYLDLAKKESKNIPPPPPPVKKSKKSGPQVDDVLAVQQKATPEQIAEYNTLAKQFSKNPNGLIKSKDVKRIKYLYGLMSDEQKKGAESFPKITPPPPPPPISKNATSAQKKSYQKAIDNYNKTYSKKVDKNHNNTQGDIPLPPPAMDTISTYNSLAKRAKLIPNNRKNNLQYLIVLFNKMSDSNKEKVENPSSISKYISQLDNLTTEQAKKVNDAYNKIKARAQSKGRKFYTTAEYKELEELYASMLNN